MAVIQMRATQISGERCHYRHFDKYRLARSDHWHLATKFEDPTPHLIVCASDRPTGALHAAMLFVRDSEGLIDLAPDND